MFSVQVRRSNLALGTWNVEPKCYAVARLWRFAGRAGFLATTRLLATEAFGLAAIDRRAPLTSDGAGGSSR